MGKYKNAFECNVSSAAINENEKFAMVDIPVKDIHIAKYQKPLNMARCCTIAENFNPHRMRPIDVSFRDGKFWVFDGQHRRAAYIMMNKRTIPAILHTNLTYEDEAKLFAHQQDNVGSVTFNHKWHALSEANDSKVMEIEKICKDWGFVVLAKNNKGNNIKCVKTLTDLYDEFGPEKIGTILMCIATAWNYMDHSVDVAIIGGIARLIRAFPEQFDYNRLEKVLETTTPKLILRDMEDQHHAVRGESRRAAYQILSLYNKGLSGKKRLDAKQLG